MGYFRDLSEAEKDEFIKNNQHGVLSFAGDKPYALPMGYMYKKGDLLIGLTIPGRKMDYIKKNPSVCFTICQPRWQTPGLKESCTSVVVEGELEEVTDRAYYGLELKPPENVITFRIKANNVGCKKCTRTPCEILAR